MPLSKISNFRFHTQPKSIFETFRKIGWYNIILNMNNEKAILPKVQKA